MADAAVKDLDLYVMRTGVAALETERRQWGFGILDGIATDFDHEEFLVKVAFNGSNKSTSVKKTR
jgi:hypothetical protein